MATVFIDLQERDKAHRLEQIKEFEQLRDGLNLDQVAVIALFAGWGGAMPPGVSEDLKRMLQIVADLYGFQSSRGAIANWNQNEQDHPVASDPFIVAIQAELGLAADTLRWSAPPELDDNALLLTPSQRNNAFAARPRTGNGKAPDIWTRVAEVEFGAILGILSRERRTDPSAGLRFEKALASARGEYSDSRKNRDELYRHVLTHLVEEGDHQAHDRVSTEHWAGIVEALAAENIKGRDMYLQMRVRQALKGRAGDGGGGGGGAPPHFPGSSKPSWIDINLPDLESQVDSEIVADNLKAMQALYFSSVLEEGKLFQVMDRVLEQFNIGVLPLGKGPAGDKLYKYYKRNFDRFTETERRNLYARAFGTPGGEAMQDNPNRGFHDLWFRFISSVSEYRRQLKVDSLLSASTAVGVSQEQLRKSARDLAANLSLYGYGVAYFAATELQAQIFDIIDILNDDEIKGAYGARDIWQVVDQVATLDLGGARNAVQYRTMAHSGAVIIRWLAENAATIGRPGSGQVFNPALLNQNPQMSSTPLVNPTSADLVDACEQYLAVTGTSDMRVEEYAQPTLSPEGQTSRPIQIPNVARDLLDAAGISGVGLN